MPRSSKGRELYHTALTKKRESKLSRPEEAAEISPLCFSNIWLALFSTTDFSHSLFQKHSNGFL
jgi:hypothetical protein